MWQDTKVSEELAASTFRVKSEDRGKINL